MLTDNLLHKDIETIVNFQKPLHCCAGQILENGDEVCWVSTVRHRSKLITQVHQVEQLMVIVAVASAEAQSTDHVGNRDHDVA